MTWMHRFDLTPTAASRPRVPRFGKPYYSEPYNTFKKDFRALVESAVGKTSKPVFEQYRPLRLNVLFHMPIPTSWSKKKQHESIGKPHFKKPDADNLVKAVKDAMNGLVYHDDGQVAIMSVVKVYSVYPDIIVTLEDLE